MQEQDPNISLSSNTLSALREFAIENNILKENDEINNNDKNILHIVSNAFDTIEKNVRLNYQFNENDYTSYIQTGYNPDYYLEIELKSLNPELGQTLSSTGLTIWRAADMLSKFLYEIRSLLFNKDILELGAGLGLCSILLAMLGRKKYYKYNNKNNEKNKNFNENEINKIVITDGDDLTIDNLEDNLNENLYWDDWGGRLLDDDEENNNRKVELRKLLWGENITSFISKYPNKFNYIIAADVIYEEDAVIPLFDTVLECLKENDDENDLNCFNDIDDNILSMNNIITNIPNCFILAFARRNVPITYVLDIANEKGFNWYHINDFKYNMDEEFIYIFTKKN